MTKNKVFCLGVSKTGTTSLGECLKILGYRHLLGFDPPTADLYLNNDMAGLDKLVEEYDSFDDWPWPSLFRRYAKKYPDSKFVLTVRDPQAWLKSYKLHCERYLFNWPGFERYNREFFGAAFAHGQEQEHIDVIDKHSQTVRDYFKDQPDRFLEIRFGVDSIWDKLCPFLGCEIPNEDVPHVNVKIKGIYLKRLAKKAYLNGYGRLERAMNINCRILYRE